MPRTHIYLLALSFILTAVSFQVRGQGFLQTNGKAIVDEQGDTIILRGMGLGGWMLQEGYMLQTAGFANAQYQIREKIEALIGTADTDAFYDAWLANHVRKIDIDSLKSWGFNSVRLPMHYNLYTLPIEDEPVAGQHTWLNKGFELTDSLISWCKQNEMYVILDLHAAPGGQGQDQGISDYNPNKPSLWESQANKDKTVALWKRLAERYEDEPWIAGYDLLNEPNWPMAGNAPLRSLYGVITDSIRAVDNNHIIFIEGNWFANDFTGLTPPWDGNMVYSPHKYWSFNDQASIQWVLDIRETYDTPLYLGESGENSNTWFRNAIQLIEDNGIGWAWWPMKKIEAIAGPVSVIKTPDYQTLLNYWGGSGSAPNAFFAKSALMEVTENLKLENCIYQKDVIDAMFRQVAEDDAKPYKTHTIPGVVYATDFDMGRTGVAYFDTDIANYHVSTGNYTAWNKGWAYRNDGVDIEKSSDNTQSNGYNVGWIDRGEWMQYDLDVTQTGVYEVNLRTSSATFDGSFHLSVDGSDITNILYVAHTGAFDAWQTTTVADVVLTAADQKLIFYSDGSGYNLGSMEFVFLGPLNTIDTDFLSASTRDEHTVILHINKPIGGPLTVPMTDFQVFVNGTAVPTNSLSLDANSTRSILIEVNETFTSEDVIKLTYSGTQVMAIDTTALGSFFGEDVQNTIPKIHAIPGKIEAEDFAFQSGIQTENTLDVGGGKNIGHLDVGDYADYLVNVTQSGTYELSYRTAAQSETGGILLQKVDDNGEVAQINSTTFASTGDWQTWATTTETVQLPAGKYRLRMLVTQSQFNLNWMEFTFLTSVDRPSPIESLKVFPNPSPGQYELRAQFSTPQAGSLFVYALDGKIVWNETFQPIAKLNKEIDIHTLPNGNYLLVLQLTDGTIDSTQLVKVGR